MGRFAALPMGWACAEMKVATPMVAAMNCFICACADAL
jgi:hypothetical protein